MGSRLKRGWAVVKNGNQNEWCGSVGDLSGIGMLFILRFFASSMYLEHK
jgi:hypothetical protein